jgi:hypothetical protein
MEERTIQIDGVPTVIRPMGTDYVVGDDPADAAVEYAIKCWPGRSVPGRWPNAPIVAYFRKIMDAYGTGAITAWQERRLVGLLPFMPVNCGMPEMVFCVCHPFSGQTSIEEINAASPTPFEALSPKVLKAQCASVSMNLYRRGLGTDMARYLVDWANEQGWERIEGFAFSDADFFDAYKWLPSIHFWKKAGFEQARTRMMDIPDLGDDVAVADFALSLR